MRDYKHIIISRVAMKWYEPDGQLICESRFNMSWDKWLENSIYLYDTYCRASLRNQKNQNFILLTIVDESVKNIGKVLPNEYVIRIKELSELSSAIEDFVKTNISENLYLFSRLDRDDCFAYDYVDILQKTVNTYLNTDNDLSPIYIDIDHYHMYDNTNDIFTTTKYSDRTSPFTSILTNTANSGIYAGHGRIKDKMKGFKIPELNALQIIHGENISNRIKGYAIPKNTINKRLLDFGIKKNPGFAIDPKLYTWLFRNLKPGSTILELGSGYGTIDLAKRFKIISIENDPNWLNLANSKYIYAPIIGTWYDRSILEVELPKLTYDLILVDGPWIGSGSRLGFLENIDLFDTSVTMIFDDTHRTIEHSICTEISKKVNRPYTTHIGLSKKYSIIENIKIDETCNNNSDLPKT